MEAAILIFWLIGSIVVASIAAERTSGWVGH